MAAQEIKKMLFLTAGSRGDTQPYLAVATGLRTAGFDVGIASGPENRSFVETFKLKFFDVFPDCTRSMKLPEVQEALNSGNFMQFLKIFFDVLNEALPETLNKLTTVLDSFKPDALLVTGCVALEGCWMARTKGIPYIVLSLQEVHPLTSQRPTVMGEPTWMPIHRTLDVLLSVIVGKEDSMVNQKRKKVLEHLPEGDRHIPQNIHELLIDNNHPVCPILVGISPSIACMPDDCSVDVKQSTVITGYWTVDEQEQLAKMDGEDPFFGGDEGRKLTEFIGKCGSNKPLYIGWGSMLCISSEFMCCLAVRALMKADMPGIICAGWAGLGPQHLEGQKDSEAMKDFVSKRVIFVKTVPHEWLFPQVACIVHHGGAGTTAASLRAGVPTIITPCIVDQFFFANMITEMGLGKGLAHLSKVAPDTLAAAIKEVACDSKRIDECKDLKCTLCVEDGVGVAVQTIKDWISNDVMTGKQKKKVDARAKLFAEMRARKAKPSCSDWLGTAWCSSTRQFISVSEEVEHVA